jgi:hypothetical protein
VTRAERSVPLKQNALSIDRAFSLEVRLK